MLAPDTVLQNRYCIIRQLGQGGMGTVYEAKALRLNTTVAIKEALFTDERLRKQFEREAQLLASLRHSALPRVIDHFDEGDGLFLVMDFIAGEDLWKMLRRNRSGFPPDRVLEWADQLLDALDYLHNQKPPIIHRDIKPQNLKLLNSSQIILLDFGLAKGFAGQISHVTTLDSIYGYTPNYAPLEQIQGAGTEPCSDLYSLAATLHHLLTGNLPPDVLTRLAVTSDGQPDPLRPANEVNPSVTLDVAAALSKAMSIGRSQRFFTAAEMRQRLCEANRSRVPDISESVTILPPTAVPLTDAGRRPEQPKILSPPTLAQTAPAWKAPEPAFTIAASPRARPLLTPQSQEVPARRRATSSARIFGFAGSALLIIGTFCPLVSVDFLDQIMNVSYFSPQPSWEGVSIIVLGIAGIIIAVLRKSRLLLIPGILTLAITAYDYFSFKSKFSEILVGASESMRSQIENAVSMKWGWIVLILGGLTLLATGALGRKAPTPGAAEWATPTPPYTMGR